MTRASEIDREASAGLPIRPGTDDSDGAETTGFEVLRSAIKSIPAGPGVYRMLDRHGELLYVGKAKSLRKRVANYVKTAGLTIRIQRMVQMTRSLEVTATHTEVEPTGAVYLAMRGQAALDRRDEVTNWIVCGAVC